MKKTLALLVCACMLLAVLAGCGSGTQTVEYTDDELAAQAATAAESADTSAAETATVSIATGTGTGIDTYPLDTVVATVNGDEITWEEYYYWLYYYVQYSISAANYYGISLTSWDASGEMAESESNANAIMISAQYAAVQDHIYEQEAETQGLSLASGEIADEVQQQIEYSADQYYGDQDGTATEDEVSAMEDAITATGITEDFLRYQTGTMVLNNDSFIAQYGENGENYPDEDVAAYVEEKGLMHAKHIMLLTEDTSTGEALDEDTCAEKYATAEDLLSQLQAVQDDPDALNSLFDELMNTCSEDTGLANYPDGYVFASGDMVEAFEIATEDLDVNYGLSGIIQSDYGYHIILRMPVEPDDIYVGTTYTIRDLAANADFTQRLTDLYNAADIQWNDEFTSLDMQAIFG